MNIKSQPILSIIVIFYNMRRESERTLFSLSTAYQKGVSARDYEIIAIDNGSTKPLDPERVKAMGDNFTYHFIETESVSPAAAINYGSHIAKGTFAAIIVDGARLVTPGVIKESLRAIRAFKEPFICTLGWHLGPNVQNLSIQNGYDQGVEDGLLESISWRDNGYRLFNISTIAQSSNVGLLGGMPNECSWFAMRRKTFVEMGGYNEQFLSPGGGLVNHDFLNRVMARSEIQPVVIIGEGSFHQFHGGVATNVPMEKHPFRMFKKEFEQILGEPYEQIAPSNAPYYMGPLRQPAKKFLGQPFRPDG